MNNGRKIKQIEKELRNEAHEDTGLFAMTEGPNISSIGDISAATEAISKAAALRGDLILTEKEYNNIKRGIFANLVLHHDVMSKD